LDGDKGGVGKSFMHPAAWWTVLSTHEVSGMPKIDKLIVIDADPMNPDVVCDNGYKN
jgi:CO dehydrogenase nickel-insertion accessory protein CooC1